MKTHTPLIIAALMALALAGTVAVAIAYQSRDFNQTVNETLKTSAGYDKEFINMVNRLERELAGRASFGYAGGKDPMTGRLRQMVYTQEIADIGRTAKTVRTDPVRLSAIIFDDKNNRHTAVLMDGERSYSVEVGDMIRNRTILKITDQVLVMEADTLIYQYDIQGNSLIRRK